MKPRPPEPGPDVASGRSGIHPSSATGDQCDTRHLSQCQLWGSGVGTQSKEASGASHKGKAHLPGSRRWWLMSWLSPAGPTATAPLCRMSLAIQTTALRDPSPAPEQQLLISQPSASLAAAQNGDFTQFTHGFSSREVFKGADGRWHLIPFGCGFTELP